MKWQCASRKYFAMHSSEALSGRNGSSFPFTITRSRSVWSFNQSSLLTIFSHTYQMNSRFALMRIENELTYRVFTVDKVSKFWTEEVMQWFSITECANLTNRWVKRFDIDFERYILSSRYCRIFSKVPLAVRFGCCTSNATIFINKFCVFDSRLIKVRSPLR